ncbi:transcriptional regulator [Pseudomonas protegens]|uniref:TetR/AcrR family transcriptional regulator n=1 Tax=Pseudomonas protegens TaxID=380021 RepID=UPI000C9A0780|nr:TetR/AcrR family transcriptional regulator [Pseudomonas protegens]PNG38267.1 transcriptional regulator [Pseudomonas protegens]
MQASGKFAREVTSPSSSHEERLLRLLTTAIVNRPRASMLELAQMVGVSRATLHRFCGTRDNLLQRLEAHARQVLEQIIGNARLQQDEFLPALDRLIGEHLAHRDLLAFLVAQYRPDFLDEQPDNAPWRSYLNALDSFFLRGQQQGVLRIDITAAILSELFISLVYGMVDAEQRGRAASANTARTVPQVFLYGACPQTRTET